MSKILFLFISALVFTNPIISAAFPTSFTYQGSLKQNGVPVNGTVTMQFNLTNSDGSQVYWTSGAKSVTVKEGLYRIDLSIESLDLATIDPYIETRVGTTVLLPREKLTSVPYALTAKDLAGPSSVKGDLSVSGLLQASSANQEVLRLQRTTLYPSNFRFNIVQGDNVGDNADLQLQADTNSTGFTFRSRNSEGASMLGLGIDRSGYTYIGKKLFLPDGTLTEPTMAFTSDTDSGITRLPSGNIVVTSNGARALEVTSNRAVRAKGTSTNDNAVAGDVGETIESIIPTAMSFAPSGSAGELAVVTLTAGDWLLFGTIECYYNGGTITTIDMGISSASKPLAAGSSRLAVPLPTATSNSSASLPGVRFSLSSTTPVVLNFISTYSGAAPKARGRLTALRIR